MARLGMARQCSAWLGGVSGVPRSSLTPFVLSDKSVDGSRVQVELENRESVDVFGAQREAISEGD